MNQSSISQRPTRHLSFELDQVAEEIKSMESRLRLGDPDDLSEPSLDSMSIGIFSAEHYRLALLALEQARAQMMLAHYFSLRGE